MRYLVWLLVLANLGMFVWVLTQPEPQPPSYRPAPVPPGVEPLVLLSERPAGRRTNKADNAGGAAPEGVQPEDDGQAAASPPAEVPQPQASAEAAVNEAVVETETDDSKQTDTPPEPVCQAVGPFMNQTDAEAVSTQLAELGYQPNLRTAEVRNPAGYWVYMPAMPAAEARRIVAELDAKGMTDYYIGKQNYISLGIFSGKRKAQVRLDQIRSLGYDAVLDQRFRTRTAYWIDIVRGAEPLLATAAWQDILSQHADIRVQHISCE